MYTFTPNDWTTFYSYRNQTFWFLSHCFFWLNIFMSCLHWIKNQHGTGWTLHYFSELGQHLHLSFRTKRRNQIYLCTSGPNSLHICQIIEVLKCPMLLACPVVCLLMISYLKIEILSMFRAGIKIHIHLVDSWATSEISHTTFIWLVQQWQWQWQWSGNYY